MAMFSLKFLKYVAPLGVTVTTWLFLTPSWEAKMEVYNHLFICAAISVIFSIFTSLSVWTRSFFAVFGGDLRAAAEQDYYEAQYMWATEMKYHKDHFMLKPLPESVNPEYLKPGQETSTGVEVVKASYGVATAQVVAEAGTTEEDVRMKGGRVMKTSVREDGGKTPGAYEPKPTVYGAAGVSPEEVAPDFVEGPPPAPSVSPPSAPLLAAPASSSAGGPATWEFEAGHGWKRFDDDCHDFIEKQYQKYQAGKGKEQVEVKTGGDKKISLNFKKMTQKLVGSATIRNVRRREG